jgi:hypothetical protein
VKGPGELGHHRFYQKVKRFKHPKIPEAGVIELALCTNAVHRFLTAECTEISGFADNLPKLSEAEGLAISRRDRRHFPE